MPKTTSSRIPAIQKVKDVMYDLFMTDAIQRIPEKSVGILHYLLCMAAGQIAQSNSSIDNYDAFRARLW